MEGCVAGCGSCCGSCGSCGQELSLTELELKLLQHFAQVPFLPVAKKTDGLSPVYFSQPDDVAQVGLALTSLKLKGLIRIDYDLPLNNYAYEEYADYPIHGSMALTALGQEVLELLEVQGIEQ